MKIKNLQKLIATAFFISSPAMATMTMPGFLPPRETTRTTITKTTTTTTTTTNVDETKTPILEEIELKSNSKTKVNRLITDGKGIWVNVWNYPTRATMPKFIAKLKKYNIDTIYLQINRSTTEVFKNQTGLDAVLKAAHENDIKVIGWSYCFLNNVTADADKFIKPALYVSPNGDRLDGMAADIEENVALGSVKPYTEKIRKSLPKNYPLIAIVFSPRIKQNYPWEYIGHNWDVLMPMVYWHGLKNRDDATVEKFVSESIMNLRKLCKKDDLNIHLITDGERTSAKEIQISLDVAKQHGVNAGISIYPEHLATEDMLDTFKDFSY